MSLRLLGFLDRLLGIGLLLTCSLPARVLSAWLPARQATYPTHVFLKLKGGGSLIIALPSLLALKNKELGSRFILVCTTSSENYARLTGLFDELIIIDDRSLITLVRSAGYALRCCFRVNVCWDLEPNSLLAAAFAMLSCARHRLGFVSDTQPLRRLAYTQSVAYNPSAPIYLYYDQIVSIMGVTAPSEASLCRDALMKHLPASPLLHAGPSMIGIAAFTSDFAPERMMPPTVWATLLAREYINGEITFVVLGTARNRVLAAALSDEIQHRIPQAKIVDTCGRYDLSQTAALIAQCDYLWSVDTGLLHIARLLGVACRSYWGPTMPSQRLRPIPNLKEETIYRQFICSPCVQVGRPPPCQGRNLCMITMNEANPNLAPSWINV